MFSFDDCERIERLNRRYGPCEDDYEVTAPYVDMCPDDSPYDKEDLSPLNFGKTYL